MFIDRVILELEAGSGGNGACSFLPYKRGPDGGDGGRGGDIIISVDPQLQDLSVLAGIKKIIAGKADHGGKYKRRGADGKDKILALPRGTRIVDLAGGQTIVDLQSADCFIPIAKGGKGGRGNWHFATATHQVPREHEPGGLGQKLNVQLDLHVFSDVALVGLPNSGKSTILNFITNAQPKIAEYPFTTTQLQFGSCDGRVIIELPAIISGSHKGKGLGNNQLKHLVNAKFIGLCLDSQDDPRAAIDIILDEIAHYDKDLLKKPKIIFLTKVEEGKIPRQLAKIPVLPINQDKNQIITKIHELSEIAKIYF